MSDDGSLQDGLAIVREQLLHLAQRLFPLVQSGEQCLDLLDDAVLFVEGRKQNSSPEDVRCSGEIRAMLSCQINEGDLLISRANTIELVGASVVVQNISKRLQLSDKVLRLRCVAPIEYWLNYVLKSPLGRLQIEMMATGAQMSMRNISQKNLDRIAIPLPPMDELDFIVDEIRRTRIQGDHLLELCKAELTRSTTLRQSILKDAFAGRLVPQDPNDEPASELLARIRAEREAGPTRYKTGRPRI